MTIHKNKNGKAKCGAWSRFLFLEDDSHPANCKRCLGQVQRRQHTDTVNRGWLKRRILEGKVMAKCNYYYTDDYAFDAAYNYQQTDWLKARIEDDYDKRIHNGQCLYFRSSDFCGYGWASRQENGDISLGFGFCSYSLRVVE